MAGSTATVIDSATELMAKSTATVIDSATELMAESATAKETEQINDVSMTRMMQTDEENK